MTKDRKQMKSNQIFLLFLFFAIVSSCHASINNTFILIIILSF